MSDTDFKIHESLKQALKNKQVVPFIGAGVSRAIEKKDKDTTKPFNPLFPSWKEFLVSAAMKLRGEKNFAKAKDVIKLIHLSEPDYLKSAEIAKTSLKTDGWNKLLNESFKRQESEADSDTLKLSRLVWQLGSNLIYTTNIDDVLEWKSVNSEKVERLDTQTDEFAELQQHENIASPTVVYLHGHISNKANIVFTQTQYEKFYDAQGNEAKLQTLRSFLTRRSFLFLGFSLDDPYFLKQLNYIHDVYKGAASSFYVLLPEWEKDNKNIPEYVNVFTFSGFGKPLFEKVQALTKHAQSDNDAGKGNSQIEHQKSANSAEKERLKNHFNVPFASKGDGFVGRVGKLDEIWDALSKDRRAAIGQAVAIEGFGGLGKTQLAVEYANDHRARYENGVFWLAADEDLDIQLIKIGEELHWISQFDKGFDQAEFVRNRFRKLSDCLVIFDNLVDQESIKNYLPVGNAKPHILITSQKEQNGFYPINLDILKLDEAHQLLTNIAEREPETDAEKEALENILTELDGLPLAVELVGGYLLRRKNISFQDYYKHLENEPLERLEKRFPNESFTHHDKSIIRTLKISEEFLDETRYLEEILDVLAWSGKSSMGFSLLRQLVGTDDDFALQDALGVALELHFIKQEEDTERFSIHRLLARVRRFERPLNERREWHQKIVNNFVKWIRTRKEEFEFLTEFEVELIHLRQWQSQCFNILPIETVYLIWFEAYPSSYRGNYRESKDLLEKALNLYQANRLNDEKLLANLYNDLGSIANSLGDANQALELRQKALSIGRKVFDKKSEDIARFLDNLSTVHHSLSNYQEALKLQRQALKIFQELFGEKHFRVAITLGNLGSTNSSLGNHQKALKLQKKALKIRQEVFGEKHPHTAASYNNIGTTYGKSGKHLDALKYIEKALEINRELLGKQHPTTILFMENLASKYLSLGNKEKAGRKVAEFFNYIPQNHPAWKWFEEISRPYRPKKKRHGKRRH